MSAISVSPGQKEATQRLIETDFVHSALRLEGSELSEENLTATIEAYRAVRAIAELNGARSELSLDQLSTLGKSGGGFRKGPAVTSPVTAEQLSFILEGACRWFNAESFAELNPAEQAAIVLLRLIELRPFENANERLALVAASLFTMRSGLPPIIIRPEQRDRYLAAIDEGLRANTKLLVEMIAESLERGLARMIEALEKDKDQ